MGQTAQTCKPPTAKQSPQLNRAEAKEEVVHVHGEMTPSPPAPTTAAAAAASAVAEEDNPYLRMRAEKIKRNEAKLASLGLLRPTPSSAATSSSSSARRPPKSKKRQAPPKKPSVPVRRSGRHAGAEVNYKEWSGDTVRAAAAAAAPKRAKTVTSSDGGTSNSFAADQVVIDEDALLAAKQSAASAATKPSTKNTTIHTGATVRKYLGQELEYTGKAATIEAAVEGGTLSFNKYSGICEWENDAIFLWVNINAPGADVVNEFLEGGRKMTWFGGSRMHDGTTAIQNLIRVGRKARDEKLTEDNGIVLWVRMHDPNIKGFTPYACLGRVAYDKHAPGTRPLEFVLKLLDYDELMKQQCSSGKGKEQSFLQRVITA